MFLCKQTLAVGEKIASLKSFCQKLSRLRAKNSKQPLFWHTMFSTFAEIIIYIVV